VTTEEIIAYIRQSAAQRGVDPDVAVRVAASEGLYADPEEGWQSKIVKDGVREPSYGPFQLYTGGGLGNEFIEKTGLDPRDPSTVKPQIDFALEVASKRGWSPWMGAKAIGLGPMEGINSTPAQTTPESERAQYGLGDRDPGTTGDIIRAVQSGQMLKSEAAPYVSEELLAGISPDEDEDSFFDRLGEAAAYIDYSNLGQAPEQPDYGTPSMTINRGRQNTGSRALQRMGIASLA